MQHDSRMRAASSPIVDLVEAAHRQRPVVFEHGRRAIAARAPGAAAAISGERTRTKRCELWAIELVDRHLGDQPALCR